MEALLIGALAAVTLAALAALLLARAISRPVGRVAAASRAVAGEQTVDPVPEEGARELVSLARSFNEMAHRLASARAAERQFLLSVSHELKTPLTAIRGYAEGLQEGAVPEDEAAETIQRESARLERLVRDLLDLGRMRRSEFSVRREPIDLGAVARECRARYEGQARDFGVSLEVQVAEPAGALGDADRMVQVVSNLVENALRAAPPGGTVRIAAALGQLAVADDGPGLEADDLPRAFERFYLYSRYGRERPVGTGLGLAIVKELVEGMGGTVGVDSAPGRTVFTVRLPLPPPEADVLRPDYGARIPA
jgi:two-component system sensor histidine kinase BaeS